MKSLNFEYPQRNLGQVLFPKFGPAKTNAKQLKIRGLLACKAWQNGKLKNDMYKITTNTGEEYALASDDKKIFSLEKYIGRIIVAIGFIDPESDDLQLVSVSLPNPPIGFSKLGSVLREYEDSGVRLNQFETLFNVAQIAA